MCGDKLAQNFECLDKLKYQLVHLFGNPIMKPVSMSETTHCEHRHDEIFKPRSFGHRAVAGFKCKGDWMKRPISNDEIAWLAKLLVKLSAWINESLGLSQDISSHKGPSWSYIELSPKSMCGTTDMMKAVLWFFLSWLICLSGAGIELMRKYGLRVNFRVLALKKVVMMLLIVCAYFVLKKAFTTSHTGLRNLTE